MPLPEIDREWVRQTAKECFRLHHAICGAAYGPQGVEVTDRQSRASVLFGEAATRLQEIARDLLPLEEG